MIKHSNRIDWDPFKNDKYRAVLKEKVWKSTGSIQLEDDEVIIPSSLRVLPYLLQKCDFPVLVSSSENLVLSDTIAISLEHYLYAKKSWSVNKPIFCNVNISTELNSDDNKLSFFFSCISIYTTNLYVIPTERLIARQVLFRLALKLLFAT